ncbi:hypothetical protein ElyMa_004749200 [Elysia marginata]|uniref:Uncharacterized protein n=1 Tax=Elysia marginata TaxID=1093978 RepID=A0AAV4ID69_9GAST|nr:hypothetical protein ElyMa_004749200 [Elysia marginata]
MALSPATLGTAHSGKGHAYKTSVVLALVLPWPKVSTLLPLYVVIALIPLQLPAFGSPLLYRPLRPPTMLWFPCQFVSDILRSSLPIIPVPGNTDKL